MLCDQVSSKTIRPFVPGTAADACLGSDPASCAPITITASATESRFTVDLLPHPEPVSPPACPQADGSHQHRVGTVTRAYQPAWSADGTTLAYVHVPKGVPGDIWTVRVADGTPKRITHDATTSCGDAHPVFSPRGGVIAYDQQPGTPVTGGGCGLAADKAVYTQNLSTGSRHLISNAWNPDYRADGRGLVFTGDREPDGSNFPYNLYASNLAGGFAQRVRLSDALCVEGEPCFNEGAAAPSSTLASPQAVWVETLETGDYCLESNVSGAGYCKPSSSTFLPENLDWRP